MSMLDTETYATASAATNVGRRPEIVAALAVASPEFSARPVRRTFTARDKMRILSLTDQAARTGEIGGVLRRQGIYPSTLCDWRRQRDAGAYDALTPVRLVPAKAGAPAEIYATLLDEGVYHCSIRTMYRILDDNGEVHERRQQPRHPVYQKPELLAERPNEVWSWDITKLMGPAKWNYFCLYVILDIYSRRVVGWRVADAVTATLFKLLFDDAIEKHNVPPGQLTLHADRGGPMKAKATAFLLADLGVTRSHNRPHTSDDNPFSESHFKTLKYQPRFPKRFGCIEDARSFCREFFDWYNQDNHHAGIGLMTPDQACPCEGGAALRPDRCRSRGPPGHARPGVPEKSGTLRQKTASTARQTNRQTNRRMDRSAHAEKSGLNARIRFGQNCHDVSCPPADNVSGDRSLRRPLLYAFGPLPLDTVAFFDRAHARNRQQIRPAIPGTAAGQLPCPRAILAKGQDTSLNYEPGCIKVVDTFRRSSQAQVHHLLNRRGSDEQGAIDVRTNWTSTLGTSSVTRRTHCSLRPE